MTRKRFIKLLMAAGIHRNAANYIAKIKSPATLTWAGYIKDRHQITNCKETKGGAVFTVKLRETGGGHE
jgi:hypothetical protein